MSNHELVRKVVVVVVPDCFEAVGLLFWLGYWVVVSNFILVFVFTFIYSDRLTLSASPGPGSV